MRTNTHTFPFFLFNLLETILKLLETLLFPSLFKVRLPPRISFNVFTFLYIRHKSLYNNSEILHFFFFLFFYFCSSVRRYIFRSFWLCIPFRSFRKKQSVVWTSPVFQVPSRYWSIPKIHCLRPRNTSYFTFDFLSSDSSTLIFQIRTLFLPNTSPVSLLLSLLLIVYIKFPKYSIDPILSLSLPDPAKGEKTEPTHSHTVVTVYISYLVLWLKSLRYITMTINI